MKIRYYLTLLFILGMALLLPSVVCAQNWSKELEVDIQRSIRKIAMKLQKNDQKEMSVKNSLGKLSSTTRILFDKIEVDGSIDETQDSLFVESLEKALAVIKHMEEQPESYDNVQETIDILEKDFMIKIGASPLGVSDKFIKDIEVSVFTKKDGDFVDGYDVKCNYLWEGDQHARFTFNNQTNEAKRYFAPGYYIMWIEKNGTTIQKKEKIEIGNIKKESESIIFNL